MANSNLNTTVLSDMTFSCWLKFTTPSGTFADLTSSTNEGFQVRPSSLGQIGWAGIGGPTATLYSAESLDDDNDVQWHYVAFVRQGTTYSMYVDNKLAGVATGTVVPYSILLIGKNTTGNYMTGNIDDVRLYDRALSWGEIGALYGGAADRNGNGIPDSWEVQYFGSTNAPDGDPNSDKDGDGMTNLGEYIAGTDPTNFASKLGIMIGPSDTNAAVSWQALQASGIGYAGKTRYYDLESTTNLETGPWLGVPDATNIVGNNTTVIYLTTMPDPVLFYRVGATLK